MAAARAQLERETLARLKLDDANYAELLDMYIATWPNCPLSKDVKNYEESEYWERMSETQRAAYSDLLKTALPIPPPWSSDRIMAALPNIATSTLPMHAAFKQSPEYMMLTSSQKRQYTKAVNSHARTVNASVNASATAPSSTGEPEKTHVPTDSLTKTPDRTTRTPEIEVPRSAPPTPPQRPDLLTSLVRHGTPDIRRPSGTPTGPPPPSNFQPLLSEEDIRAMGGMDEHSRERYMEELRVAAQDRLEEEDRWRAWWDTAAFKGAALQALQDKNEQSRALQETLRVALNEAAVDPGAMNPESQVGGFANDALPINNQDGDGLDPTRPIDYQSGGDLDNPKQLPPHDDLNDAAEDEAVQTPVDNSEEFSAGTFSFCIPCS